MCSIVEEGTPLSQPLPVLEPWVRDFVNSSPDPVVAYDGAGRTLWLNTAAEDLLGRARRDALGMDIAELLPGLSVEARLGAPPLSLELAGGNGEPLPVRVSLSCLRRDGPPLWLARLEDLRTELPLEDLLTTLSHELRSPLQAILSWAQLLRSSPTLDVFTERGFVAIERNVRWQVEVIEDILEMSQLLSGEFSLELQPLPLSPFVEEALQELTEDAALRGIRLTRTVEADEREVLGDRRALRSVVRSLLVHSLKHGSDGGSIDVDLRRNASCMQLSVREAGPQPPGAKPAEADSFRPGSASSAGHFGGLGVGLMKTQRLVEMHGGSVWAESEGAGRGALWMISLPLASEE
jgi:signal transduction histidine kinase